MNDDIKQQLSALVDGELDPQRAAFLLRRLDADSELSADWSRWHLARACLRRETAGVLREDFAAGISAALAAEAAPRRAPGAQVLRWAGGFAVAASVAVAALLAVPAGAPSETVAPVASAAAPARVVASTLTERDLRPDLGRVAQTVAASTQARPLGPALRLDPQLESYLLRHNAALRQGGHDSFLPFVPMAAPVRPWTMLPVAASEDAPR